MIMLHIYIFNIHDFFKYDLIVDSPNFNKKSFNICEFDFLIL